MRFGINAIAVMTGGAATYFANLLPIWGEMLAARGDTLFIYTRKGGRVHVPAMPALVEVPLATDEVSRAERIARQHLLLPLQARKDKLDVFFGPGDSVPLGMMCPTVVAYRNPNVYSRIFNEPVDRRPRLLALRALALTSARSCSRAIFVSAVSRDEIVPVIHLKPEKARVVHHGLGDVFQKALTGPRPWDRPYLLSVSTIYHYKNYIRLVQAYDEHVKKQGLPHGLVIVGATVDTEYAEDLKREIVRRGLQADVQLTGEIQYPGAGPWFKHADAFVFPSFRETFGHPLLEAMAADLPVAAADIPVMREIGGEVPFYFDPMSVDDMGRALREVLVGADRTSRLQAGRDRLQEFTWRKTAEKTLAVLDEAAR
jgi:glycosyltransferase involved in cell wall biosynthesis